MGTTGYTVRGGRYRNTRAIPTEGFSRTWDDNAAARRRRAACTGASGPSHPTSQRDQRNDEAHERRRRIGNHRPNATQSKHRREDSEQGPRHESAQKDSQADDPPHISPAAPALDGQRRKDAEEERGDDDDGDMDERARATGSLHRLRTLCSHPVFNANALRPRSLRADGTNRANVHERASRTCGVSRFLGQVPHPRESPKRVVSAQQAQGRRPRSRRRPTAEAVGPRRRPDSTTGHNRGRQVDRTAFGFGCSVVVVVVVVVVVIVVVVDHPPMTHAADPQAEVSPRDARGRSPRRSWVLVVHGVKGHWNAPCAPVSSPQKNPADAGLVRGIDTARPQPNRLGSTSRKTGSLSSSWLKSPSSMPPRSSIANKRWARDKWATGLLLA